MGTYVRRGTWVSYETGSKIRKNKTQNVKNEFNKSRIETVTKPGSYEIEPNYRLYEVDLTEMFEDNSNQNHSFKYKQPLKKLRKQA